MLFGGRIIKESDISVILYSSKEIPALDSGIKKIKSKNNKCNHIPRKTALCDWKKRRRIPEGIN